MRANSTINTTIATALTFAAIAAGFGQNCADGLAVGSATLVPAARTWEGPRTAAEWLAVLDDIVAAEEEAIESDPELADLARGLHGYHWGQWWDHPASEVRRGDYRRATERFRSWMLTEGMTIVERWRNGETLSKKQTQRLMIARMGYVLRPTYNDLERTRVKQLGRPLTDSEKACIDYQNGVADRAKDALRQAYWEQCLTQEYLNTLREYRMAFSPEFRPARLGFKTAYGNEWGGGRAEKWQTDYESLPWGKVQLPDVKLLKFEAVLASPDYTEEYPRHWAWLSTHAIVRDYLRAAQVYRFKEGSDVVAIQPHYDPRWSDEDHVALRDLYKDKPLLIYGGDPEDCDFPRMVDVMTHMEKTYRGALNFVFIPTDINEVRLSGAANYNYFSPRVEKEFDNGHELTEEEWARRIKIFYMTWPNASFPTLLDRSLSTMAYLRSYHIDAFLVDTNGRIAWRRPRQKHYDGNLLPGAEGAQDMITYDVLMERAIIATLSNGGRSAPTFRPKDLSTPNWRFQSKQSELQKQGKIHKPVGFYISRIAEIDRDAGEILLRNDFEKLARRDRILGLPTEYSVRVDDESEIRHLNVGGMLLSLEDLQVGDRMERISIWEYTDDPGTLCLRWGTVKHNEANKNLPPRKRWGNSWLIGCITDRTDSQVTVLVDEPNEKELIGYQFWKESGSRATMPEEGKARAIMTQLERWLAEDDAARTYRFGVDAQTFVYLNGWETSLSELDVGDVVRVWYALEDGTKGETVIPAAAMLTSRNHYVHRGVQRCHGDRTVKERKEL
jgi:hypothetical protein